MNNDFDPKPNGTDENGREDESVESRIRRGYSGDRSDAQMPDSAPDIDAAGGAKSSAEPNREGASAAPSEGGRAGDRDYRYKATPIGTEHYYDHTRSQPEQDAGQCGGYQTNSGGAGSYNGYNGNYYGYNATPTSDPSSKEEQLGTLSLVLGIIGAVFAAICCGGIFFSLLLGIAGIICARMSRSPVTRQYPDRGGVGLIFSIIAVVLGAIMMMLWMFLFMFMFFGP